MAKSPGRSRACTEGTKVRRRWLGKAFVERAFRAAPDSSRIAKKIFAEKPGGA